MGSFFGTDDWYIYYGDFGYLNTNRETTIQFETESIFQKVYDELKNTYVKKRGNIYRWAIRMYEKTTFTDEFIADMAYIDNKIVNFAPHYSEMATYDYACHCSCFFIDSINSARITGKRILPPRDIPYIDILLEGRDYVY